MNKLLIEYMCIAESIVNKHVSDIEGFKRARYKLLKVAKSKHAQVCFDRTEAQIIKFCMIDGCQVSALDVLHLDCFEVCTVILPDGRTINRNVDEYVNALRFAHIVTCLRNLWAEENMTTLSKTEQINLLVTACQRWHDA